MAQSSWRHPCGPWWIRIFCHSAFGPRWTPMVAGQLRVARGRRRRRCDDARRDAGRSPHRVREDSGVRSRLAFSQRLVRRRRGWGIRPSTFRPESNRGDYCTTPDAICLQSGRFAAFPGGVLAPELFGLSCLWFFRRSSDAVVVMDVYEPVLLRGHLRGRYGNVVFGQSEESETKEAA